jgi:hypothetical protein
VNVMVPMQSFINVFRDKVSARLKEKTGWGRVELAVMLEAALADALSEFMLLTEDREK